jgi:hypothetical protein
LFIKPTAKYKNTAGCYAKNPGCLVWWFRVSEVVEPDVEKAIKHTDGQNVTYCIDT